MSINSNAFFNQAEITFYSILISCMTGASHVRTRVESLLSHPIGAPIQEITSLGQLNLESKGSLSAEFLVNIKRVLVPSLIWIPLGFAAGYLLGMLSFG